MDEEQRIADHLRTLSICHYVYAGLATLGSCLGGFYIVFGSMAGELVKSAPRHGEGNGPPPEFANMFTWIFTGVGVAIVIVALTVAVLCVLSGRAIGGRRNRTLSIVVAAFLCLNVPLGTTLGVFTLIVLTKSETQRLYDAARITSSP